MQTSPSPLMNAADNSQKCRISGKGAARIKIDDTAKLPHRGIDVRADGDGNSVLIGRNADIRRLSVELYGKDNKIIIERGSKINARIICKGDGNLVHIGHHVELNEAYLQAEYGTNIVIGAWGIYSVGLVVRSGDSHSVVDIKTLRRINQPDSIHISERVWAGYRVSIMKGVRIQPDTIIAAASVVTRSPKDGRCIIAGTPAKIVRRGVFWDKRSLPEDVEDSFWQDSLKYRGINRDDYLFSEPEESPWNRKAFAFLYSKIAKALKAPFAT
jgi:acetyltransferase-like isoleucine patch superfamily enzyme